MQAKKKSITPQYEYYYNTLHKFVKYFKLISSINKAYNLNLNKFNFKFNKNKFIK